jgi:hypothetical protein
MTVAQMSSAFRGKQQVLVRLLPQDEYNPARPRHSRAIDKMFLTSSPEEHWSRMLIDEVNLRLSREGATR